MFLLVFWVKFVSASVEPARLQMERCPVTFTGAETTCVPELV